MESKPVSAYWWTEIPNFGDALTPYLLDRFAHLEAFHASLANSNVITVGSVLDSIPRGWNGYIAGAGRIRYGRSMQGLLDAHILGVRGPLSAIGLGDVAIGDPGLLANELVSVGERDITLGIVPHWSDTRLAYDPRFKFTDSRIVISAWQHPLEVVRQIGRCEVIVTSSLHGAIVADAFGLPRRLEMAHRFKVDEYEGGTFKFEDYNASIGLPFRIGERQQANWQKVSDVKDEIYDMYRLLASSV